MKKIMFLPILLAGVILSSCASYRQIDEVDDVYGQSSRAYSSSGGTAAAKQSASTIPERTPANTTAESYYQNYQGAGTNEEVDEYYDPNYKNSKYGNYTDTDGDTYVTNNYYDGGFYDDYYSSRIRRFHRNHYHAYSFYDPFWYGYGSGFGWNSWGMRPGWNVSIGYGWGGYGMGGWGMNYGWNSWGYNPYWGSPWGYSPWGMGNNWAYMNGYNQGYWNGYNQGYWAGGGGSGMWDNTGSTAGYYGARGGSRTGGGSTIANRSSTPKNQYGNMTDSYERSAAVAGGSPAVNSNNARTDGFVGKGLADNAGRATARENVSSLTGVTPTVSAANTRTATAANRPVVMGTAVPAATNNTLGTSGARATGTPVGPRGTAQPATPRATNNSAWSSQPVREGAGNATRGGSATPSARPTEGYTPAARPDNRYSTPSAPRNSGGASTPSRGTASPAQRGSGGTYGTPARSGGSYGTPSRSGGSYGTPSRSGGGTYNTPSAPSRSGGGSGSYGAPSRSGGSSSGGSVGGGSRGGSSSGGSVRGPR